MAGKDKSIVEQAFDKAYELREERAAFLERQNANREVLRNLSKGGFLTDEQVAEVNELYPPRRKSAEDVTPEQPVNA